MLRELCRQAERAIDHQAQAMEQLDGKTQQTMGLAMGALAGGIAILTFVSDAIPGRVGALFVSLVALGGAANLAPLFFLTSSYVGFRTHADLAVGPDPAWLLEKATQPQWSAEELALSLLAAYPGYAAFNDEAMRRSAVLRRVGLYLLAVAVLLYAGLGLYAFAVRVMP